MISAVRDHGDYYLVSDDFHSYIETHATIDEAYKNQDEWLTKSITSVARMGFFSSDRCINEYAEESKSLTSIFGYAYLLEDISPDHPLHYGLPTMLIF